MSIIFAEGFEKEDTTSIFDKYPFLNGNNNMTIGATGRRGGNGCTITSFAQEFAVTIGPLTEFIMGGAFDVPSTRNARSQCFAVIGSNRNCTFTVESDGSVAARRGFATGTIVAQSAAGVINDDEYNYIEWYVNLLGTGANSSTIAKVNDVEVFNVTNVDLIVDSVTGQAIVTFGGTNNGYPGWVLDDLYIVDPNTGSTPTNTFLTSAMQVDTVSMNTDGTTSDFTPSGAGSSHADRIDEDLQDGDTTHLVSSTPGDIDLFNPEVLPVIAGGYSVGAIKMEAECRRTYNDKSKVRFVYRPTTANYFSQVFGVPFDYGRTANDYVEINPETGLRWKEAEIGGLEIGIQHFNV